MYIKKLLFAHFLKLKSVTTAAFDKVSLFYFQAIIFHFIYGNFIFIYKYINLKEMYLKKKLQNVLEVDITMGKNTDWDFS